jgi:hypothetical protein
MCTVLNTANLGHDQNSYDVQIAYSKNHDILIRTQEYVVDPTLVGLGSDDCVLILRNLFGVMDRAHRYRYIT